MEYFIEFVKEWGYIAVLLGSMIEGESVILTAGALAHAGYLSLPKIMVIAFLGTLFADQGLYQVGYHYGPSLLERFPSLKSKSERAFRLLHTWDVWYILTFRFIYGIRIISPLVIGAAGVKPSRFIGLNFVAAGVWSIVSCYCGYLLGDAFHYVVDNFDRLHWYFIVVPIAFIGVILGFYLCITKIQNYRHKKRSP